MRIPLVKIYRAFPELDRFTDAECTRFIKAAQQNRLLYMLAGAAASLAASLAVPVTIYFCATTFLRLLGSMVPLRLRLGQVGVAWIMLTLVGSGAVAALVVRDLFLRRLVRRQVGSARCTACDYQLLGLKVVPLPDGDALVLCPECGERTLLSSRGLSAAELTPLCAQDA